MRTFLVVIIMVAGSSPAFAAATPWQDVAPGARLRLVSSDVRQPDGTTLVGLELDMPDSYKTYWRLPGETGIPTELDTGGSAGIADPAIQWPYPKPEASGGFLDYVYHGRTVLPVKLKATGAAPQLRASVTMGVCSEVCVPVRASFALPLSFKAGDAAQSIRLQQALALAPIAWTGATPAFEAATYDTGAHALRIALDDPAVDPESVIVTTSDPTVIFDAPQKSRDGHSIVLPMRGTVPGAGWVKNPVQLTFMTPMGSFEVSEQVTTPHS